MQTNTKTNSKGEKAYSHIHTLFHKHKFTGTALVLAGLAIYLSIAAAATTAVLLPQANGNYQSWTGSGHITRIDEAVGSEDCSSNESITSNTNNQRESYTVSLASIPDGSTISSVDIQVWDRGDSSAGGTYRTFTRLNGTDLNAGSNLSATGGSGDPCSAQKTQTIDVADTAKSGATTLEIGVIKINGGGSTNNTVRLGAIRAVVTYSTVLSVTAATGGSAISADNSGGGPGSWTTLTGPIISEGSSGDIGTGTIILNAPSGFSFDTGGTTPSVTITRTGGSGINSRNINGQASGTSVNVTGRTASAMTFTVTSASNNGVTNSLTWQNVRVRPSAGTPLATGNITKSGTSSISGVTGSTNFGTLTEVVGAKDKLVFTTQPSATATVNMDFSTKPEVKVEDQFGNILTTDTSSIVLTARTAAATNCFTGSAGSGTITSTPSAAGANAVSGVLTYTAMQYSTVQNIKLCATTGGARGLSNTITVSAAPPTVTGVSSTTANGSYKAGVTIPVTVTFSESVTVTGTPRLTLSTGTPATTAVDYTGGSPGSTLTFNYTVAAGNTSADLDYNATTALALNGGTIKDTATGLQNAVLTLSSPGAVGSLGANKALIIDTAAPGVTLSSTAANPTNVSPIPFKATFTEAVNGFDQTDITVGNGAVTGFTPDLLTAPIGSVYDFTVTPLGLGAVTVDVAAAKCQDLATNANTVAVQLSRSFDNVQPTLTLSSTSSDPTNTAPIPYTATFSEPVTGFALVDIAVVNGSAGSLLPAAGPAAVYTFNVTPNDPDPSGPNAFTVTVDVAGGAAIDSAANGNTVAAQLSRSFTGKNPVVTLTSVPVVAAYTNASPLAMTATFSEAVTGFYDVATDIVVTNGALTNFVPVSATVYTFDITPTLQGAVKVDIPAAIAIDVDSNPNYAAAQYSTIYDSITPSITAAQALDTNGDGTLDRIALTFNEAPADVAAGSNGFDVVSLTDHGSCNSESIDPDGVATSLNLDFVCSTANTSVGDLNVNLVANTGLRDAAGNQVTASLTGVSVPAITDGAKPVVVSTTPAASAVGVSPSGNLVVNFSEPMNTSTPPFAISDNDSNTYTGTVWSNANKTATLTHNAWTLNTPVTATVDGSDLVGNSVNNAGTYSWSFTVGSGNNLGQITVPTAIPVTDGAGSDLSNGVSTAGGGNILIDNVLQSLGAVTSGNLVGDDLSLPQIVGDVSVTPLTSVTMNSTGPITVQNPSLTGDTVEIPNNTTLFGCNTWDGKLNFQPGANNGSAPTGFSVGTMVYEVGSVNCPLLLDKPATITLLGVTGNVAYKPTGSTNWFSIGTCGGTYAVPTPPAAPVPFTECAISDGTNTKILTYHFTAFGPIVAIGAVENQGTSGGYSPDAEKAALAEEKAALAEEKAATEALHGAAEKVCNAAKQKTMINSFVDLIDNPAKTHIAELFNKCAIDGLSKKFFGANDPITRAELSKILAISFNLGKEDYISLYDDLKETNSFAPYLLRAVKLGLIRGESVNALHQRLLKPDEQLTRAEALQMILKAKGINLAGYDKKAAFVDVNADDWFYEVAAFAQNEKLMDFDTTFIKEGMVEKPYKFKRLLGVTDTGKDVQDLKSIMMQLDYFSGEMTNVYDLSLADALKSYQRANGIFPSGNMGYSTRTKLLKEYLHPKQVSAFRPYALSSRAEIAKLVYAVDHLSLDKSWTR